MTTTSSRITSVERATGRSWDAWLRFMESIGAPHLDHKQITLRVYAELDGTIEGAGWWTQAVTVAYEQYIGRRQPGQRSDGTFQASVSRSTTLGMAELMSRWQRFAADDDALQGTIAREPRVSGTDRRLTWRTQALDGSRVVVTSEHRTSKEKASRRRTSQPETNRTASIVATQIGLPTSESNDEARDRWAATLERFLNSI